MPSQGCVYVDQSTRCDDNDVCTTNDACNPVNGLCTSVNVSCAALETPCLVAFCYAGASNASDQCRTGPIQCVRPDNCSVVQCVTDQPSVDGGGTNYTGCVNTTVNCDQGFIGVIAGLVGGAIAGIVVAAAICVAAASASGAAYAVSQNYGTEHDMRVENNPLYKGEGKGCDVDM